jgi:hypothetical protein
LRQQAPDVVAIRALADGVSHADDAVTARLAQISAITLPDLAAAEARIAALVSASGAVAALTGTAAATARRIAALLSSALLHYSDHPSEPCPVCGGRILDETWAADAQRQIRDLTAAAAQADLAHTSLASAERTVRTLIATRPAVLNADVDLASTADTTSARRAWEEWEKLAAGGTIEQLIAEAATRLSSLSATLTYLRNRANSALDKRKADWKPIAAALTRWTELAPASQHASEILAEISAAILWLRRVGHDIRNARMTPFAAKSALVWDMLRQESNVQLGPIRLEGTSTQRRVALDVTVDDIEGAALGVMSQGELHALGLALFLPRATSEDSPFRFVVIDDPVQSMDPAKVDGLARLFAQIAQDRQVIVFTHDDRLPAALRRLQLPATIWEVVRREGSAVELKKNQDPVLRYLDDARALALTPELPPDVRAVAVAGYCRSAVEVACQEVVRTRRIKAGARHADVEQALEDAETLHDVVTLALFDNPSQGDQVRRKLHDIGGRAAVDAFRAAKAGTHDVYQGDLRDLVRDTTALTRLLRS